MKNNGDFMPTKIELSLEQYNDLMERRKELISYGAWKKNAVGYVCCLKCNALCRCEDKRKIAMQCIFERATEKEIATYRNYDCKQSPRTVVDNLINLQEQEQWESEW